MYCDVRAHEHDREAGMSPGHVLHVMTASGWAAARLRCIAWVLVEGVQMHNGPGRENKLKHNNKIKALRSGHGVRRFQVGGDTP